MKKFLIIALTCFLILGLCSCGNSEGKDEDSSYDSVADTTDNGDVTPEPSESDPEPETVIPEATTFTLSASTSGTRWFGEREYIDRIYPTCNYPGSGFESKIKCDGGTISVKFMADGACSFLVYLDGELQKNSNGRELFAVTDNLIEIKDVTAGEHTLRLIRATEFGSYVEICAITFAGELLKADGIDEERTFVEFIGDGVESKVGAMNTSVNVGASYPYLVANEMNVDYSITSFRGFGLTTEKDVDYMYGEAFTGNFERKADIVVINVGSFDMRSENVDMDAFKSAYREFITKVKQTNGNDCKIVLLWTSGNETFENVIVSLCNEFGGEYAGYFAKVLDASADIPPSESEHNSYAETLVEFINEVKNFELTSITSEQIGAGNSVVFGSDEWADLI